MKTHSQAKKSGYYEISGARAIDGDTIECVITLPFDTLVIKRVRLRGWWAPELNGPNPAAGKEAKAQLQLFLQQHPCLLFSRSERLDKHGRVLACLFTNGRVVEPREVLGTWAITEEQHKAEHDWIKKHRSAHDLPLAAAYAAAPLPIHPEPAKTPHIESSARPEAFPGGLDTPGTLTDGSTWP